MKVLALETATAACSVALLVGDVAYEAHAVAPRQHTGLLLGMVDQVLAEAGVSRQALDLIAFGRGPGAFTGVRVAASVAQGLALARDLPVAPVSTLAALAAGGARLAGAERVAAALDARREEIYFAALEFPAPLAAGRVVVADCVLAPENVALADGAAWLAVGNGWSTYASRLPAALAAMPRHELLYPHASDVARLGLAAHRAGASVAACDAHPFYLRGALD